MAHPVRRGAIAICRVGADRIIPHHQTGVLYGGHQRSLPNPIPGPLAGRGKEAGLSRSLASDASDVELESEVPLLVDGEAAQVEEAEALCSVTLLPRIAGLAGRLQNKN